MRILAFLFLLFAGLSLSAQSIKPEEQVVLSDTVLYMGIDFSMARMVNPEDVDKAADIREKNMPAWATIDDFTCRNSNLKFDFQKKRVFCNVAMFDSSYLKLDNSWVLAKYDGLTDSMVTLHVKSYPLISGYRLGVAFVIDKMDRTKGGTLIMDAVYIDLSNNTVVKIIKCTGSGDGIGYTNYWTNGIESAYGFFKTANYNYLQRLKHHFKKAK
jgi:hypothetical protein